jgi:hypothetical protein
MYESDEEKEERVQGIKIERNPFTLNFSGCFTIRE